MSKYCFFTSNIFPPQGTSYKYLETHLLIYLRMKILLLQESKKQFPQKLKKMSKFDCAIKTTWMNMEWRTEGCHLNNLLRVPFICDQKAAKIFLKLGPLKTTFPLICISPHKKKQRIVLSRKKNILRKKFKMFLHKDIWALFQLIGWQFLGFSLRGILGRRFANTW